MASRGTSASTSAVSTARTQRDSLLECVILWLLGLNLTKRDTFNYCCFTCVHPHYKYILLLPVSTCILSISSSLHRLNRCAPEILEIEARSPKLRYHSMRRIQSPSKTSRVSSARSGDSSLQEKISDDVSSSNASRLGSRISTSSVHYPGQHPRPSSGTFQVRVGGKNICLILFIIIFHWTDQGEKIDCVSGCSQSEVR